uniref:Uncharacterized protein n=1 Tax=Romanomermis culicivorax TaxID=13658 RepID=A0A915HFZ8_ROMCU
MPCGWEGEAGHYIDGGNKTDTKAAEAREDQQCKWGRVVVEQVEPSYCLVLASAVRVVVETSTKKKHDKRD